MRNYIILNGKNSNEINGLLIQELPPISKPLIRTEVEEIDGRDGDIVTPLGYSAYDKEFTIGLYKDFDVNEVAAYFNSEGTVIFSNEPDKYYYYQITAQIDFERLVRYRTATVTMHCQPFKYSATEQPITEDVSGTVSDEGTNLALENTAEAPFNTLDLKGNTSQQTYTGKNKLEPFHSSSPVVLNGITCTYNATDQTLTFNGTATSDNTGFYFATNNVAITGNTTRLTTYYVSGSHSGYCKIRFFNSSYGGNIVDLANLSSSTPILSQLSNETYTLDATKASIRFDTGATANNFKIKIMVADSHDTAYEPYVGGVPAPNPDYPQAVQTVTGENVVKICKKNLFDVSAIPYVAKRAYSADGSELVWENYSGIDGYQQVAPNTTYTITKGASGSVSYLCEYDKNKAFIQRKTNQRTFTTTANTHYLRWSVYSQGNVAPTQTQLEIGSTATAYEPYQGQSYEVNLGKNLFDKNNASGLFAGYISSGKAWTASGYWSYYIPCQPNTTYTASRTIIGNGGRFAIATSQAVPANNVDVAQLTQDNTAASLTITTNSSAKYIIVWFANINDAGSESLADWEAVQQLELGSQATSYAAYFEPIELCNIPGTDYRDRFIPRDGKWYVHKEVGKTVLVGTESIALGGTSTSGKYRFNITVSGVANVASTERASYSDNFIPATRNETYACTQGMSLAQNLVQIYCEETSAYDLDQFKAWLASHNTTVYYPLATPTDTEITNEALIAQLDDIYYHAHAYKGRTHITSSAATGNVPHIIAAEVGEDNESTITNAGNYLSKPKITVYGSGDISLYINDMHVLQITLGDEGYITIDTAQMEAYKDTLDNLKNRLVIGDYSNARLKPGANKIHFTGTVTKYIVENYSRWL